MQKTCPIGGEVFEVTDDDLIFYEAISPVIAGKKYVIPAPTLCPMLRNRCPVSAVVVVLPLVPVIASTGAEVGAVKFKSRKARAKSSISPITGNPCATAWRTIGRSLGKPGDNTTRSMSSSKCNSNTPAKKSALVRRRRSSTRYGGFARVSARVWAHRRRRDAAHHGARRRCL